MDDLLPVLLSFPPHPPPRKSLSDRQYEEGIKPLIEGLRNTPSKQLLQPTSSGEHLLDVINPGLNTIPYAFALLAHRSEHDGTFSTFSHTVDRQTVFDKMALFLNSFDSRQIIYIGWELNQIVLGLATLGRTLRQLNKAVEAISNAILRLHPAASTLTSMHIALVQLALESQAYEEASPVLDHNVLYIPTINPSPRAQSVSSHSLFGNQFITLESRLTQRLKPQEVLEYFTFGGTVYIGLRQWDRALDMLDAAITYPVKDNATSKIMAEAYKKWSLVNLVLNGKPGVLPSTVNGNAAKNFHVLAKPYNKVASLFESATASRLKEEIEVGHEIWRQDRNSGLMNCVLAAHQEFQIRNLATLYRTISIPTITQTTVSAETGTNLPDNRATETLIMGMISRGDLDATIHRPQGEPAFLSFESSAPVLSESEVDRQLILSLEMIKSMTEDIKSSDQQLTHDKEYLKWAYRQKKTVGAVNDMFAGEELGWSNNPDEDLMAP